MEESYPNTLIPRYPGAREYPYYIDYIHMSHSRNLLFVRNFWMIENYAGFKFCS